MRHQGRISSWKDEQGFGFIAPHDGSAPVFIHIKAFDDRRRRPLVGDIVTYEVRADDRGRLQATDVALADRRRAGSDRGGARRGVWRIAIAAFVAFLVLLALTPLIKKWMHADQPMTGEEAVAMRGSHAIAGVPADTGPERAPDQAEGTGRT